MKADPTALRAPPLGGEKKSVLVLGGGFAGLSAAIYVALAGGEVTLLERSSALGGKAGRFERGGFRFDTGPSVFTLLQVVRDIFEAAGEPLPFELKPLDLLCRYRFSSGRVWDVYQDFEKTTAQLSRSEAEVYRNLLNEARKLYEAAAPTFVFGRSPSLFDLTRYGLRHGLKAHPTKTLAQLVKSFGATGELEQFFLRFATYFGADPYRAPAVLHNIAWVELGLGVSYPVGGIYAVVEGLAALAKKLGVRVCTGVEVEGLESRQNRLTSVQTSTGTFKADAVISSLDVVRTHQLLGKKTRLEKLEPSLSGFVLLLGIEGETPELAHHTISFSDDYPAEFRAVREGKFPGDPTLYFNVSSKTESADAPAGCENWFVMANAPALGGKELDEEAYAKKVLGVLERRGFNVKDRLRFTHVLGPRHLAQFAHRGSIYGTAPYSLLTTLRPRQKIRGVDNLFLAGGTVHPGGGIPLALLSGRGAAELALG